MPHTITSLSSRASNQYRLNMPMNQVTIHHPTFEANEAIETCAGAARVEPFTVHTTTPHLMHMHMHTAAPNRLQDDLCNLWRLHNSLCQHTPSR
jgi:hypothetical protein